MVRVQQIGDRSEATYTQYLGDDLDARAIHPSQRKLTKRQQTGNSSMNAGPRCVNFDPKAETNLYLKRAQQMGKRLITASTQWMDFGIMVVLQRTTMPRVVAKQRMNTCH